MSKFHVYQKFEIFAIVSYLSSHFYTYNVAIFVKRTDLENIRNASTTQNFCRIAQ